MRNRFLAFAGALGAAVFIAQLAFVPVAGQTQSGSSARPAAAVPAAKAAPLPPKPYVAPRTPDGHVDLQGIYDISTVTPFERPQGVGQAITDEEASSRLQRTISSRDAQNKQSDANRAAPPVGGDGSSGAYGNVGGYNQFWLDPGDTWITINGERRTSIVVDPPDGRIPRLPAGRGGRGGFATDGFGALPTSDAGENSAPTGRGAYDNPEQRPLSERCLLGFGSTSGPPTLPNGFYNNTKQIVQTGDYVMILNEMVHDARVVRMNSKHMPSNIRYWMGDSIGRWEGDTLVIETTNFTDKTRYAGSTPNLKVTERLSRLDEKTLLYRFTIEDPAVFAKAWSGEVPWHAAKGELYEYACHEGNYALGDVLRGERLLEKEAAEAAGQK